MIALSRPLLAVGMVALALLGAAGCRRATSKPSDTGRQTLALATIAASCRALPATCGSSGHDDCCQSLLVPGGTFERSYDGVDYLDANYPATVSDFYLDKYEITVGRFRAFVNAGLGTRANPPREGAGAHPRIAGSGWNAAWNDKLPADTAALRVALACLPVYQTWTDAPGGNENKPVNCVDWYTAFAFCAWDGGRLVTEAEWNYAASGGSEHRYYPWSSPPSSTTIDDTYAVFCGGTCRVEDVGSRSPKGDGRWGHADLGGNAWEWMLDWRGNPYPMPCHDCANLDQVSYRVFRGGSFDDIASTLRSAARHVYYPNHRGNIGARCARDAVRARTAAP